MSIHVEITSQDRSVYAGEADIVVLPGSEGEMGILPNHSPLLTTLKYGIIKVRSKEQEQDFTVAGGVAEVQPNQIIILADAAENVVEIDIQRAEAARQRAQELLAKGIPPNTDAYLALQAAIKRSNLRLDAAKKYRHYQP